MAAGLQHTVLLCCDGEAVAFGKNDMGQCELPECYISASAGINHTLLLQDDGYIVACGGRSEGQCEVPDLPDGLRYVQAAAGYCFSIVIREDGAAFAFGDDTAGQCRIPALPPGERYVSVSASRTHAVLLRDDGQAIAWGHGQAGECRVPELPDGLQYVDAAAGGSHTVLIRSDGVALAFGHNGAGQCDLPDLPQDSGLRYIACAASWTHTVLLRDDGEVFAFGGNGRGQCNVPPLADGLSYVGVAAGGAHTLLLRSDGIPVLFGDNRCGQCSPPELDSSVRCVPPADPWPVMVVTLLAEDGILTACCASGAQLPLQPAALGLLRRELSRRLQLPPKRLQLVSLEHVAGTQLVADGMTKQLTGQALQNFKKTLGIGVIEEKEKIEVKKAAKRDASQGPTTARGQWHGSQRRRQSRGHRHNSEDQTALAEQVGEISTFFSLLLCRNSMKELVSKVQVHLWKEGLREGARAGVEERRLRRWRSQEKWQKRQKRCLKRQSRKARPLQQRLLFKRNRLRR
eukprot:g727.t1